MITFRPHASIFHADGGWFSANWHFSFDTYHDPENTWFGDLRVFNDDRLVPGSVQRVTLGSGMEHSERNHSKTEPMRFIQMWIIPAQRGLEPSIEQRSFGETERLGRLLPVLVPAQGYGGPDAPVNADAVTVHQDAAVYATLVEPDQAVAHRFRPGFNGYLFLVHGDGHVSTDDEGGELDAGGAAKVVGEREVTLRARSAGAEALLVETRSLTR